MIGLAALVLALCQEDSGPASPEQETGDTGYSGCVVMGASAGTASAAPTITFEEETELKRVAKIAWAELTSFLKSRKFDLPTRSFVDEDVASYTPSKSDGLAPRVHLGIPFLARLVDDARRKSEFKRTQDGVVFLLVAHELAHHLQHAENGCHANHPRQEGRVKNAELEADALAGALLHLVYGQRTRTEEFLDTLRAYEILGDAKFGAIGHHGFPGERIAFAMIGSYLGSQQGRAGFSPKAIHQTLFGKSLDELYEHELELVENSKRALNLLQALALESSSSDVSGAKSAMAQLLRDELDPVSGRYDPSPMISVVLQGRPDAGIALLEQFVAVERQLERFTRPLVVETSGDGQETHAWKAEDWRRLTIQANKLQPFFGDLVEESLVQEAVRASSEGDSARSYLAIGLLGDLNRRSAIESLIHESELTEGLTSIASLELERLEEFRDVGPNVNGLDGDALKRYASDRRKFERAVKEEF